MAIEPKREKARRWRLMSAGVLALLVLILPLAGCDDDDDGVSRRSLNSGWSAFTSGDWQTAVDEFLAAVEQDQTHAEAWCGLGWSEAMLDLESAYDLREAVHTHLLRADALREDYSDAWAGLAQFASAHLDTLAAVEWSLDVVALEGDFYAFEYNSDVNSRSMRKIAAWNLYKLTRYEQALEQVQAVFPSFSLDFESEQALAELLAQIHLM